MSEFDKWWEENYMNVSADRAEAEDIYNIGPQSQQAKIDELQKKYDAMHNAFIVADDCRKDWHESYMSVRLERDELQAMVDKLELINDSLVAYKNELLSKLEGNEDEN